MAEIIDNPPPATGRAASSILRRFLPKLLIAVLLLAAGGGWWMSRQPAKEAPQDAGRIAALENDLDGLRRTLDESKQQWAALQAKLTGLIDPESDSLRFYFLGSSWKHRVEHVGATPILDLDGPLMV